MGTKTITLNVSENLYAHLEAQAQATARSINEIAVRMLNHTLEPNVEDDLPPALQTELKAMAQLSDDALWQIAQSVFNSDKAILYDTLLERAKEQTLTIEGREWLTRLREESESLMLRKAHAYALLKNRGHQLPTLAELRQQSS